MCGRDLGYSVCVAGYPEGACGTQDDQKTLGKWRMPYFSHEGDC